MNFLQQIYPGDTLASFIIRVLVEITLITIVAILFTRVVGKNNPAMRHGICLCALFCVLFAPLTTLGLEKMGWQTFQIALEREQPVVQVSSIQPMIDTVGVETETERPFWTVEKARGAASLIILVWLSGTGFLISRLMIGARKVDRLRKSARPIQDPKVQAATESLQLIEKMPSVPIHSSRRLHSPVVVGPRQTTVILPEKLVEQLNEQQLRSVLAHELTHVRQRDPLIGLVQRLVEAAYWPHPLIHVLNRDLVRAREEVCDNVALNSTTAPNYANTLLTVALGVSTRRSIPGTIGLMTRPWRLEERVKGLLDPQRRLTTTMNTRHLALMGIALATGTSIIAGAKIVAAPYPPNPQDTLDLFTHVDAKSHKVTVTHHLQKQNQVPHVVSYTVKLDKPSATKEMHVVYDNAVDGKPTGNKQVHQFRVKLDSKASGEPVIVEAKELKVLPGGDNIFYVTADAASDSHVQKIYRTRIDAQAGSVNSAPAIILEDRDSQSVPHRVTKDIKILKKDGKTFVTTTDNGNVSFVTTEDVKSTSEPKRLNVQVKALKGEDGKVTYTVTTDGHGKTVVASDGSEPAKISSDDREVHVTSDGNAHTFTITSDDSKPAEAHVKGVRILHMDDVKEGRVMILRGENATAEGRVLTLTAGGDDEEVHVVHGVAGKDAESGVAYVTKTVTAHAPMTKTVTTSRVFTYSKPDQETTVTIENGHIHISGQNIKVIYANHKGQPAKTANKVRYQIKTKKQ